MTAQSASAKEIHVFFSPRITRMTRISLFTLHSSLFIWRPAPPLFTSEDNSDKGKTLAQKFYTLLNNRALYDTDQISGFVLPFHCYSEPNGDVVFTKNRRTINDYYADENPIHSESEINSISNTTTSSPSTSNRKSGCLGIIVALIIFTSFFINVL